MGAVNDAGKGNCGDEESIPLMLIEVDAVEKVVFMYFFLISVSCAHPFCMCFFSVYVFSGGRS